MQISVVIGVSRPVRIAPIWDHSERTAAARKWSEGYIRAGTVVRYAGLVDTP
jgi:hypothetical protein